MNIDSNGNLKERGVDGAGDGATYLNGLPYQIFHH
jgi:hypothetical protein